MSRKTVSVIMVTPLLICVLVSAFNIQPVKADWTRTETIYIRADGSIDPSTASISSVANITYTFTDDIYDGIVVQRSNITIDGDRFTLEGYGSGSGFHLSHISNVTIQNTNINNFLFGIYFYKSSFGNVSENNITNNNNGVWLSESSYNIVSGNNIMNNDYGLRLIGSSYNIVSGNNIMNNDYGLRLDHSSRNSIYENNITNNNYNGVVLDRSSNNTLSGNVMSDNKYNLDVTGFELRDCIQSIDISNLVNGKPVYYIVNQKDIVVNPATHPQVGYLALVDCNNVEANGLTLKNNGQGLLLAYTSHARITENNITNNYHGASLLWSRFNIVSGNNIMNNDCGVQLDSSSYDTVSGNNITNNGIGVAHLWSPFNIVSGNNIMNNDCGVAIHSCKGRGSYKNRFSHNNFISNTKHMYNSYCFGTTPSLYTNFWDDGTEGNYWSNRTGIDLNHNGISDSRYVMDVNNRDNRPLMGIFYGFNTSLGYQINIVSNSTIEDLQYFESNSTIKMYVSNSSSTQPFGFCRVCIPKGLMSPPYTVMIDDGLTEVLCFDDTLHDNGTHRWIYFAYPHSTHKADIIPEFSSFIILPLFMMAALVAVIISRRKHSM